MYQFDLDTERVIKKYIVNDLDTVEKLEENYTCFPRAQFAFMNGVLYIAGNEHLTIIDC